MRTCPRLGAVNFALIALYLAPLWGADAVRTLTSPFNGFEDPVHATVAIYLRRVFDLPLADMIAISNLLGGIKLVAAAGFVAYLIEFSRALATGREVDRATLDVVLLLAAVPIVIWAAPALALGDPILIRLYAAHLLLVVGAMIVVAVELLIEHPKPARSRMSTAKAERKPRHFAIESALPSGLRRDLPAPTFDHPRG
jgi:hypothetical protein